MKSPGEVAAIYGYNKQYEIFAIEIYESLLNNQLEWLELASGDVGKLDDVYIVCKDEIKAYQVKDVKGNLTFLKFFYSDTESIFQGCFRGWKVLKLNNPNHFINTKYISNEIPSKNDKIDSFDGSIKPSFSDFRENFWNYIKKSNSENIIPIGWENVFEEIKSIVNSNKEELFDFIKSFEFVIDNDYDVSKNISKNNFQRIKDIDKISKNIFKIVGTQGSIKLDRNQFLKEFDLLQRYETHFRHNFFVDEEHYQPISETIQLIDRIINKVENGYIALIGNAGSGKSTLLTKWIKARKEKVLKYYAYVNKEMNNEFGYRGEAEIFLKDLLIQIRENQFSNQENLPPDNVNELQKQLFNELQKLSFRDEKIYIVVDGLDHIDREQNVSRSLIDILPSPEQIPKNIYFILGTRTINNLGLLPERVKLSLEKEDRTISIKPLSLGQTQNLLLSHEIELTQNQLDLIHKNTLGHPLFLRYTIEELLSSDDNKYDEIILQKNFNGDIYEEYKIFWNKNKTEDNFIELLGIIARFRYSYVDISLLPFFIKNRRDDWYKIEKLAEHFFYKKDNIWQFFHNSFKEFLREETAKNFITNEIENEIDFSFHLKIYEVIKDIDSDYKWNTIYHLYNAGKHGEVAKLATQDYFRSQWFAFRNHKIIFEDIKLASNASYKLLDTKKLFVCYMSEFELSQRINNFYLSNYYKTFHQLNKIDVANSFIFDNTELLVPNYTAIEYAIEIYKRGDKSLPFELLKKAEPIYLLDVSKELSINRYDRDQMVEVDEVEFILSWAKLKSLYLPIENVFNQILKLTISKDEHRPSRDVNLLEEAISSIQDLLIELEDWEKLNELYSYICNIPDLNLFYFYFDIVWNLDNKNELYDLCLDKLKEVSISKSNPINRRLALVEVFINKNLEKGKEIFKVLVSPNTPDKNRYNLGSLLDYIFDYSRLFYITSNDFTINSNIFSPKGEKQISTSFYNEFAELGKSFAYIHLGSIDASKGFIFRFKQILSYFHHHVMDENYVYEIQENKPTLIKRILNISQNISNEVFSNMLNEISIEWEENKRYWRNSHIQEVIDEVLKFGENDAWCNSELVKIDAILFSYGDSYSRIEDGVKQIELWVSLNEIEKGESILEKLMACSLDIFSEKDHQLDYLIDWVYKKSNVSSNEIEFLINCLGSLKNKISGSSDYLAERVLELSLDKGNGFEIYRHFLFEGYVNFNDSLEIILKYFLQIYPEKYLLLTKLFSRIILNFENGYNHRRLFLKELFKKELSKEDVLLLINEIEINSVYELKYSYVEDVIKFASEQGLILEFENTWTEKKDNYSSSSDYNELRLKEGRKLSLDEVFKKINSYKDIVKLIKKEDGNNSYFEWSTPIIKVIDKLSYDEIRTIISLRNFRSTELVKIAKAIIRLNGDKIFSKELLYEAYKISSPHGWSKHYDGGSKIKTLKELKELDNSEETMKLIFKDFIDNVIVSDTSIFSSIDELFGLIDNGFNYHSYYEFVENYKNELLKTHYENTNTPSIDGNLENDVFLKSLLEFLIEMPSNFDEIIIEILIEEFDKERSVIDNLLKSLINNEYFIVYLKLLSAISIINLEFVVEHKENIIKLLNNSNFEIHSISVRILKKLNANYKELFVPEAKIIPFSYTMEYDYKPELVIPEDERINRINKTGYLRDTNDPIEYCKLYHPELSLISEVTGFNIVNIANRIIMLGEKFYKPNTWFSNLSEKEIRDYYEHKFELKISYNRPRNQKVWFGMMIALKELWELKIIDRGFANFLSKSFDENCYFIKPTKKPQFITSIIKKDNYVPYADEKWVYELSNEYLQETLKYKQNDDYYILAERSIIEGQGDGNTIEIRQSFLELEKFDIPENENIFEQINFKYVSEYIEADGNSLCLYNWKLTINHRLNWLAFNPDYAIQLGLILSEDGNFRWVDENGNIVVESIFWKNNSTNNKSRHLHSECGYGWYIIITKSGLDKLKKIFEIEDNVLYHHQKIYRNLIFIQSRYNTYIDKSNSLSNILMI